MPFMVIYGTADGSTRYEQADAIDEAALFVERLRNTEGCDEIRIFRMEEINFAFRPYYKVELGLPDRRRTPSPGSPVAATPPGLEVPLPPGPAEVVDTAHDVADDAVAEPVADATQPSADAPLPPPPPAPPAGVDADANGSRRGLFGR